MSNPGSQVRAPKLLPPLKLASPSAATGFEDDARTAKNKAAIPTAKISILHVETRPPITENGNELGVRTGYGNDARTEALQTPGALFSRPPAPTPATAAKASPTGDATPIAPGDSLIAEGNCIEPFLAWIMTRLFRVCDIPKYSDDARRKVGDDAQSDKRDSDWHKLAANQILNTSSTENARNLEGFMDRFLMDTDFDSFKEYTTSFMVFKSQQLEEEYQISVLLPFCILQYRAQSFCVCLYSFVEIWISVSAYNINSSGGLHYGLFASIFFASLAVFWFATWEYGRPLVDAHVKRKNFYLFKILQSVIIILLACIDFINTADPDQPVGSASVIILFCVLLSSGISGTFFTCLILFGLIMAVIAIKAVLVCASYGVATLVVYLLPIIIALILAVDVMYIGDRDRRLKLLNTKIVHARLKGLQEGSVKTEYLLSLTLPPTIVTKLKEVGTGNFDLIADRFEMMSVMFADIKNYKEIAHNISNKHAVTLLNTIFHYMDEIRKDFKNLERIKTITSKMLIVGGLDRQDQSDHLMELIDMALVYRDIFKEEVAFSATGEVLNLKLQIAMGIQIGTLVAGIVGKKTFCYEVYGDVVNTASRMLSVASGGQIAVTSDVWDKIKHVYHGSLIGEREVKGKGLMKVYSIEKFGVDCPQEMGSDDKFDAMVPTSKLKTRRETNIAFSRGSAFIPKAIRSLDTGILSSVMAAAGSVVSPVTVDNGKSSVANARRASSVRWNNRSSVFSGDNLRSMGSLGSQDSHAESLGSKDSIIARLKNHIMNRSVMSITSNPDMAEQKMAPQQKIMVHSAPELPLVPPQIEQLPRLELLKFSEEVFVTIQEDPITEDKPSSINVSKSHSQFGIDPGVGNLSLPGQRSSLTPSQSNLAPQEDIVDQRRWSNLVFAGGASSTMELSRRPSFRPSSRAASTISVDPSIKAEAVVRRLSLPAASFSVPDRVSVASRISEWNEDTDPLLSIKQIETQAKRLSEYRVAEDLEASFDTRSDLDSIRNEISTSFRDKKLRYILILTALANAGGYKDELSDEERLILEHTGAMKLLKDDDCVDIVQMSLTPYLKFISNDMERRYIFETNDKMGQKFWNFSVKGILCELMLISLMMIGLYFVKSSTLLDEGMAVSSIVVIFITTGSQILITAVTTVPTRSALGPSTMLILGTWSIITMLILVILASIDWAGLRNIPYMTPMVLPQFPIVHTFLLEGITFFNKVAIAFIIAIVLLFLNYFSASTIIPLLLTCLYCTIFHVKETTVKTEYLMSLISTTQANLVKEEVEKSSHVLTTILPKRIIMKLLEDPTTMFYEEFQSVTVLHMDIAGFTAMSAKLEPLDIIKIFNNLFTFFDRLVEDFHLTKITTIGDAYVASSNLAVISSDPRTAAISVCIVALQMQSFVITQVNESYVMKTKHKQMINMRIGIHSGPCYGAIMGGDKNFRYDLMGDTVNNAEKIQEHCELAEVYISETTYNMVKDYHAFKLSLVEPIVAGQKVYLLKSDR